MKPDIKKMISLAKELYKDKAPQYIDLSYLQADFIDDDGNFRYMDKSQQKRSNEFWDVVK